jgi:hypothetical protein
MEMQVLEMEPQVLTVDPMEVLRLPPLVQMVVGLLLVLRPEVLEDSQLVEARLWDGCYLPL